MDNPRPEKTAIVSEVRARLDAADAAILTEYRGLSVAELASLRAALRAAGCDYKIYKNTLVKLAVTGNEHEELAALLSGPTAITFVSGEVSAAAKALRDFARTYPSLVVKGGRHAEGFLTPQELGTLADLPSRDVLLARLAGAIAAPLQQMAGLLQALPRNLAYGLSALLDQQGGAPAPETEPEPEPETATPEPETASAETASAEPAPTDAAPEAPAAAPAEAAADDTAAAAPDAAKQPAEQPAAQSDGPATAPSAGETTSESADQAEG